MLPPSFGTSWIYETSYGIPVTYAFLMLIGVCKQQTKQTRKPAWEMVFMVKTFVFGSLVTQLLANAYFMNRTALNSGTFST